DVFIGLLRFGNLAANHLLKVSDEFGVDHLVIGFAINAHQNVARAAAQADIDLLGYAGTVDDTAEHGDIPGHADILEPGFERVHRRDHIKVLARAAGTGNEVDAVRAQLQAFQNFEAALHFFDRIGSQRYANGVADTVHQQHAQPHRGFH